MRIIILLFLIFLNGCGPVLKIYYGYHEPQPEDKESLTRYLKKKKIDADNILVFTDSMSYYKKIKTDVHDFPEMRVFNKNGNLIYYRDTSGECSSPAYEFTNLICSAGDLKPNVAKTLTQETKNLLTLENKPVTLSLDGNYDYYVFIYWMRPLGRLNKVKTRVWENNLKHVRDCRVLVYKVNMDWQKRWNQKP